MSLAKIVVTAGDKPIQVGRVDVTQAPVKQVGPIVDMQPGMVMTFNVNMVQGLVVREKPE